MTLFSLSHHVAKLVQLTDTTQEKSETRAASSFQKEFENPPLST